MWIYSVVAVAFQKDLSWQGLISWQLMTDGRRHLIAIMQILSMGHRILTLMMSNMPLKLLRNYIQPLSSVDHRAKNFQMLENARKGNLPI